MTSSNSLPDITQQLHVIQRRSVTDMIRGGELLIEAKTAHSLAGTSFTRWLKAEFGWSERTAQNWMRAARWFHSLNESNRRNCGSGLTQSAVIELAAMAEKKDPAWAAGIEKTIALAGKRRIGMTEMYKILYQSCDDFFEHRRCTGENAADAAGQEDAEQADTAKDDTADLFKMQRQLHAEDRAIRQAAGIPFPAPADAEHLVHLVAGLPPFARAVDQIIQIGIDASTAGLDAGVVAEAIAVLRHVHDRITGASTRDRIATIADRAEARSAAAARSTVVIDGCTIDHTAEGAIPREMCRSCSQEASTKPQSNTA